MKIIIKDALQKYTRNALNEQDMLSFVEGHKFFHNRMSSILIIESLKQRIQKQDQIHQQISQLGLYFKPEMNKQIFAIYQHILNHPSGITYQILAKKVHTDIINISHYCCKLKKSKFIEWEHKRDGIVVYPKINQQSQFIKLPQSLDLQSTTFNFESSFIFRELSLLENIWINISGSEAVFKGGLTNDEIKGKIMKYSENKMLRRTVQNLKFCNKVAERQGKVFVFKYCNKTGQIQREINRMKIINDQIQTLQREIEEWLKQNFSEEKESNILLGLINNKMRDYHSSLGIKQSKRQCTPVKLNRYIKILNYLHKNGPQTEGQLRQLIIEQQKGSNTGIMHKRSLIGIIDGLINLNIIKLNGVNYEPGWPTSHPHKKIHYNEQIQILQSCGNQIRQYKISNKRQQFKNVIMIKRKNYRLELFVELCRIILQKSIYSCLKQTIKSIKHVARTKSSSIMFEPQKHLLGWIDMKDDISLPDVNANNYEDLVNKLDQIIVEYGQYEQNLPVISDEIVRYVRKNPFKSASTLKIKYGRKWMDKFDPLNHWFNICEKEGIKYTFQNRNKFI